MSLQLQVKTLSNEKFTIDCELTDLVKTVKEKIAGAKNLKDKYEVEAIKLIFSGKILEDSKTLESYNVTKDSFIVVVKQNTPKPAAGAASSAAGSATSAPANPPSGDASSTSGAAAAATRTPAAAAAAPTPVVPPTSTGTSQQQPSGGASGQQQPAGGPSAADAFASPEAREKAVKELTDMGFDRGQAEQALRAAYWNTERAADYLVSGNIPEMREAAPPGGQATTPSVGGGGTSGAAPSAQRPPAAGGVDELAELSNNPQFQALRNLIQQNPDQLQTLMRTLQQTQPDLYQMIEQRPQEFLELLNQVDQGDEGDDDEGGIGAGGMGVGGGAGGAPPGTVTITLSPQDQQAINRLQEMGFERNRVIEAFLACDRNEEMAANYLLNSFD